MENKICAITGRSYEEIGNVRTEIYFENADIKISFENKIWDLVESGVTDFICNGVYGVPLWKAEFILRLRDYRARDGLDCTLFKLIDGKPSNTVMTFKLDSAKSVMKPIRF